MVDSGLCFPLTFPLDFVSCGVPAKPTGLTASKGTDTDKVIVSWDATPGATNYWLSRDNGVNWIYHGPLTSINDAGASAPIITPGAAATGMVATYYITVQGK
jgi:hypothetical protein